MKTTIKNLMLTSLMLLFCLGVNARDFVITSYGAKKGSKTPCTAAIQQAIDECHKAGGGRVVVPKGKFVTGAIVLKSGVTLHVEQGAKLLGSTNPAHYVLSKGRPGVTVTSQLIFAANAANIGITGSGTIDGQGKHFTDAACNAHGITRPMLIRFDTCKGITVSGVTMRNSAVWMQHYYACENMTIKDIKVYNHCNNCNDGMDINGCRNVTVSGAVVDADDDGICLKNFTSQPCSNITVTNCTVSFDVIRNTVYRNSCIGRSSRRSASRNRTDLARSRNDIAHVEPLVEYTTMQINVRKFSKRLCPVPLAKSPLGSIYRFIRNDVERITIPPERQQNAPQINPNRHKMEQHKGNQEKRNSLFFRRHRKPYNAKINNPPHQRKREQRIKDAFENEALFIGLPRIHDTFIFANH